MTIKGLLFDLDGVICDTAKYHYQGWKKLANHLGFDLTLEQNEALKGLSRRESVDQLLKIGGITLSEAEIIENMELKNSWYIEFLNDMTANDALPGAIDFVSKAKQKGCKTALGSSSKNAKKIIDLLGIKHLFDTLIDGTDITNSKPHPEVFLMGAENLGLSPEECVVFEDATSGVEAALNGNFKCVGIGKKEVLNKAHYVVGGLNQITLEKLQEIFEEK